MRTIEAIIEAEGLMCGRPELQKSREQKKRELYHTSKYHRCFRALLCYWPITGIEALSDFPDVLAGLDEGVTGG